MHSKAFSDECSIFVLFQTLSDNSSCCWENQVGDEVFKVVLLDLGLFILIGVLLHLTRAGIVKFCCCSKVC